MTDDERFMQMVLRLARRGLGRTAPNPMVGALVVGDQGRILAHGHHRRAGLAHAEVDALRKLELRAPGATLYVNLEPCCHVGRTGPCVQAILDAGIRRVVVGMRDPNPRVNGRGLAALRRAGVEVVSGVLEGQCRRLNQAFACLITRGRPLVVLKAAATLDGRIATRSGDARWVSGEPARALVHRLRDQSDAVLVGAGTVLADDPLLTTRLAGPTHTAQRGGVVAAQRASPRRGGRDPLRVILDGRLRISPRARLLHSGSTAGTLVATARDADPRREKRLRATGAEVLRLPVSPRRTGSAKRPGAGGVDLACLLEELGRRGVMQLLVEGGGEVNAAFLEAGLVDRLLLFLSPRIVGGRQAVPLVGGSGVARMKDALRLGDFRLRRLGNDLVIEGSVNGRLRCDR